MAHHRTRAGYAHLYERSAAGKVGRSDSPINRDATQPQMLSREPQVLQVVSLSLAAPQQGVVDDRT